MADSFEEVMGDVAGLLQGMGVVVVVFVFVFCLCFVRYWSY